MKTRKNRNRGKTRKSLFNSESAGATVIAAVLLLCIIFSALAVVRIEYVPEWKTDTEKLHMNEVQNDMAELKSTVDMIALLTASDSNSSAYGFSVSVPFRMGGGEIPVLEPSKSSGTLSVNTENCTITITPIKSSISSPPQKVECGGITYRSNNRQYVDQVFRYENGALILAQGNKSLMRQCPLFNIYHNDSSYNVSIQAINITGNPDIISSDTDASLRLTGINFETVYKNSYIEDIDSFNCMITTKYPDAWISYFKENAENSGLGYGTDFTLEKNSSDNGLYEVYFNFTPTGGKNLDRLYISKSAIGAELGAGGSLIIEDKSETSSDGSGNTSGNTSGNELIHANRALLNKDEVGGVISSGSYIQFKNNGKNYDYWIKIDGSKTGFRKDDFVKLIMNGNQTSGSASMNTNKITNLNFNVKLYINNEFKDQGKVTDIWVSDYSDYQSNLTYRLPSHLSGTQFQVDGVTVINWWPENNSAINLYNIGPSPTNNNHLQIDFNTRKTYFDCSADYEIVDS